MLRQITKKTPKNRVQNEEICLKISKAHHLRCFSYVQRRAINAPVRKNELIQVVGIKKLLLWSFPTCIAVYLVWQLFLYIRYNCLFLLRAKIFTYIIGDSIVGLNSWRRTYNFKSLLNLNSNFNIRKILVIILLAFLLDKRKVSYTANNPRFYQSH